MILREENYRNSQSNWFYDIQGRLEQEYSVKFFGGHRCMISHAGTPFRLAEFPDPKEICLVIEYAENAAEAAINWFEDGDRFYSCDYKSPEEILRAMRREIDDE